jgi:hypothetical protein
VVGIPGSPVYSTASKLRSDFYSISESDRAVKSEHDR